MANLRFLVTYRRTIPGSYAQEMIQREMYAPSFAAVEIAVTKLPRYVETMVVGRLLPETAAETAARRKREDSGPVPHGC